MAVKGKEIAGKASSSKSKKDDSDKSGKRKRKRSGVLQFFDVAADVDDGDESEDEDDFLRDYMDEDDGGLKGKSDLGKGKSDLGKGKSDVGKTHNLPFLPKEEELSDDEIEKLLQERYKPGSRHVKYADDEDYEAKMFSDGDSNMFSVDDGPPIFKVKCTMGRERHSAFCLMQKFVDLRPLGTKLQVVSAFAPEHIKGYIYIEADRECDVVEACKGLCTIYSTRMSRVPKNELTHMVSLQKKQIEVSKGTWARVKYGKYKGDLAQIVAVDDDRKKATVKLIPRIDMQALAKKLNGGVNVKQTAVPTPKLISSSELEDFRPHVVLKRDRQTGMVCEELDGLMLKDGYLYKKIQIESLIYSGVVPSANELIKFETPKKDESDNLEWLSGLFGEKRKKRAVDCNVEKTKSSLAKGKGGEMKGFESTSGTKNGEGFDLHDLVFFGRKDFGVIISVESNGFKILKEDPEGAKVVTVEIKEVKNGCSDKKFTGLDQHMKAISVDDTVRVLEGPFKGRQGIVKQIYKGTIFVYDDENQLENDGYFCTKSQLCENMKKFKDSHDNTGDGSGPLGFEDSTTSPKSPQSPKKPWQAKESTREFNGNRREDRDGAFSVGQTLRIKIGPLKGHLCRVIAIYRSDVTVKLDSQLKVITVKSEHLSEAGVKRYSESSYTKPSSDTMGGSEAPAENDGWNSGGLSSGRNPWSDSSALLESTFGSSVVNDGSEKGKDEDNAWDTKSIPKKDGDGWGQSSWSKPSNDDTAADLKQSQVDNWGKSTDGSSKATANTGSGSGKDEEENTWGAKPISKKDGDSWGKGTDSWGKATGGTETNNQMDSWNTESKQNVPDFSGKGKGVTTNEEGAWGKGNVGITNQEDGWGKASENMKVDDSTSGSKADGWNTAAGNQTGGWGKGKGVATTEEGTWGKAVEPQDKGSVGITNQGDGWGKASENKKANDSTSGSKADGWNTAAGNQSGGWGKASSGWSQPEAECGDQASGWNKAKIPSADGMSSWGKGNFADKADDAGGRTQTDSWNSQKGFDDDGPNSFDGGRGSGGRRGGRGGGRRGGRDNFGGGGRSFGRGQSYGGNNEDGEKPWNGGGSSGWSKGGTESWNNNRSSAGDERPSWSNSTQDAGGASSNHGDCWNKSKDLGEDRGSTWNKGSGGDSWSNAKPFGGGDPSSNWNKSRAEDRGIEKEGFAGNQSKGRKSETSNWNSSSTSAGNQSGGWNKGGSVGEEQGGGGSGAQGGWGTNTNSNEKQVDVKENATGWESKSTTQKASGGNQSWGLNPGSSSANETELSKDQGDGWGKKKAFEGGGQAGGGWKSGGGEGASSWKNDNNAFGGGDQPAPNWNKSKGSNDDQSDNWKGLLGTPDKGNWGGGKSSGGDWSSGWNGGADENEAGDASNRGRGGGFGRGGRWSGSDRGGGRFGSGSDRGGGHFGSGSDRGGGRFGNRGGSDRGDFGNKGRGRRDQSGGGSWNGGDNGGGDGWSGGDNGGGGSDRGGFGNRGRGRRDQSGGGSWNGGGDSWSGGDNGGGGSDRGGFGNRGRGRRDQSGGGSWNGGGDSWNGGDSGGGGSDRGGFGNRGRGRRDQSGGGSWNGGDNGGGDSWNGGDNGGGGRFGSRGGSDRGGFGNRGRGRRDQSGGGSWNSGDNGGGGSWNGGGGWGGNKGGDGGSGKEGGGGWNNSWGSDGGNKSTTAATGDNGGGGSWNGGGGWGGNKGGDGGSGKEGGGGWNNSWGSDGGNKSTTAATGGMKKEEAGGSGGDQANAWGSKAPGGSSWGKGSGGW